MNKYTKRYQKIVNKVIKESFPELKDKNVLLKVKRLRKGSMKTQILWSLLGKYKLVIDPYKYPDAKENELVGNIAHELVHLSNFAKNSWFRNLTIYFKYKLSKKFLKELEANTDKITVKKGYAKKLLAGRVYRLKKADTKHLKGLRGFYLSPKEIKSYAKKIGKW